ncbi:MAG: 50S ribosomal protein L4 [Desulfurococcus sp.]|nr:50S ribosomal protein L4 [Desulfurococcus sp.]
MVYEIVVVPAIGGSLKVPVYNADGSVVGEVELPEVFKIPVRKDLVRRAFHSAFTAMLQPKGRDPMAGKRTTAKYWGVGYGLARVPRLPNGTARFVVSTRKGHAAFPPRTDERIHEEINKKEKAAAIASALAATSRVEMVRGRGHVFSVEKLPVVVSDEVETAVSRAAQAREYLAKIGLWSDVERAASGTGIRAGRGKMRGRRYVEPRSILFVLSSYNAPLARAVRNMPGVDVATPGNLGIIHLAPGGVPGRLTVISTRALSEVASRFKVVFL